MPRRTRLLPVRRCSHFQAGPGMHAPITPAGRLGPDQAPIAAIVRRLAVTGAMALTMFGLSSSVASAGESEVMRVKGGAVRFQAHGEIITAKDACGRDDREGDSHTR